MRTPSSEPRETPATGGYTLVEMVTVIVVMSVIGLVASGVIVQSMTVHARTASSLDAAYMADHALGRMASDVRALADTASISTFTATAFTFDDVSDETIAYALASGDLTRNGDLVAQGVTALTLRYWDSGGAAATVAADVYLIEIDLTVQVGAEPYRVQTAVFPRALSP